MAEVKEEKKAPTAAAPEKVGRPPKKKKSRPTNCAQSGKRIRRKDWYYRDGKYFANKKSFKLFVEQELEKAAKAKETADKAATDKAAADKAAAEKAASEPKSEATAA